MRAMSRRTVCSRLLLSSWPVAFWKRRLNSSSLASFSRVTSSSSATSRSSVACLFGPLLTLPTSLALAGRVRGTLCSPIRSQARSSDVTHFALHDPALHRELVDRTPQRLTGDRLVRVGELEEHTTRLHVGDPPLRRTLTGTHAGLGRLLRQRTVRVDVDPHLAATLDVPGHRDTSRLDLAVRHVRRLQGLDAELAERHLGAALGGAVTVRVVLLTVLDPARDQHGSALLLCGLAVGGRRSDLGGLHSRNLDSRGFNSRGRGRLDRRLLHRRLLDRRLLDRRLLDRRLLGGGLLGSGLATTPGGAAGVGAA